MNLKRDTDTNRNETVGAHKDRPTGLPCVPKIFLNTTSKDQICLLPNELRRGGGGGSSSGGGGGGESERCGPVCSAACGSCSLPNLATDKEIVLARPRPVACSGGGGGGGGQGGWCQASLEAPPPEPGPSSTTSATSFAGGSQGGAGSGSASGRQESGQESGQGDATNGTTGGGNNSKLSVYCSPRVSRRDFHAFKNFQDNNRLGAARSSGGGGGAMGFGGGGGGEYSWLHSTDVAKYIKGELDRRESNSSVESDSSVRSASHVSTCATSEYTRYTSCDRLSLPVHDLSPSHPSPPGRLRRIYSNPEAPFLKENRRGSGGGGGAGSGGGSDGGGSCGGGAGKAGVESQMRDSKSCSDLEDQTRGRLSLLNYSDLERKLSNEASNLLSPPPLLQAAIMQKFVSGGAEGYDPGPPGGLETRILAVGSPPPADGWEDRVMSAGEAGKGIKEGAASRDHMIRQWLKGVDPAIVVSSDINKANS